MNRRRQKGQALTEFTIGLMGMVLVFSGLLFVMVLSRENVKCTLDARSKSELDAWNNTVTSGGDAPQMLRTWKRGNGDLPFTADYTPVTSNMNSVGGTMESTRSDGGVLTPEELSTARYASAEVSEGILNYLTSASLVSARITISDAFQKRGLISLEDMARNIFGADSFDLKDNAYYPRSGE